MGRRSSRRGCTSARRINRQCPTGGSGFLGRSLARRFADRGSDVVILSRRAPRGSGPWTHVEWDGRTVGQWKASLDSAAAIVNLAGRTVDCVKTPDHCDEILRSRVESTRALGAALGAIRYAPPVWVQMSTAHIYGDPPTERCTEDSALGFGLVPTVGRAWEAAFNENRPPASRGVVLRTTFVIGRGGGALARLRALARWGLGGRVGSGRQGISWLHQDDFNRLVEQAIADNAYAGVYIATAPNPVSNATFMRTLRRALGVPIGLPAASWMVRLAAPLFLRTDPELALYGRYCVSRRLAEARFAFQFPTLAPALRDLITG